MQWLGDKAMDSSYLAKQHNLKLLSANDTMDAIGSGNGPYIFTLDDLTADFFDLSNGKAGEVFQKFTNYGVRAAFVIPDNHQLGDRVTELAREHAQHPAIRITPTIAAAHEWLAGLNQ